MVERLKFEASSNNKEYKLKSICNNIVYIRKLKASHLLGFYYLVFLKNYSKDENT